MRVFFWLASCAAAAPVLLEMSAADAARRVTLASGESFEASAFRGAMQYGGVSMRANCSCIAPTGAPAWPSASGALCSVSSVKVFQERAGVGRAGLSLGQVARSVGGGATLARVHEVPLMCVDDRVTRPSLFTPGGDIGEFILALHTYLGMLPAGPEGRRVEQATVDKLFQGYLETLPAGRSFLHCTDDRAIRHIEEALQTEGLDLKNPPTAVIQQLIQLIAQPENVGDLHIKGLLNHPDDYPINAGITRMALLAFYRLMWTPGHPLRPKLQLEVLAGDHDAQAFVEVTVSKSCEDADTAPLLPARSSTYRALVSHLLAAEARRAELAQFFAQTGNMLMTKVSQTALLRRLERHGLAALEVTGARAARNLPVYTVTYV